MDCIHKHGIWIAEILQHRTKSLEKLWLLISHAGGPKAAFLFVFPCIYFFSRRTGVAVMWVAVIAEWINLILKSMLFGERPFWWIGESQLFGNKFAKVEQYPSTCENGPGSPSGHAMVTAAVWWVIASDLHSFLYRRNASISVTNIPYVLYGILLVAVSASRVFVLAHFPHQVVTGSIAGHVIGKYLNRRVPLRRPFGFFGAVAASLLLVTVLVNGGLWLMGVDLSWSLTLAKKWCSSSDWVRPDVALFTSLARDSGAMLGLGMALHFKPRSLVLPLGSLFASLVLSSMVLYLVFCAPMQPQPSARYYMEFFIKFFLVPPIVVLAPALVRLLSRKIKKN